MTCTCFPPLAMYERPCDPVTVVTNAVGLPTYMASSCAEPGQFYRQNGELFYVAANNADLKQVVSQFLPNKPAIETPKGELKLNNVITSYVTSLVGLFQDAEEFNQDISGWDTSNVDSFERLFAEAKAFNQQIGGWITSNVTVMTRVFLTARAFNQPLEAWDMRKVRTADLMFQGANTFNQPLNGWVFEVCTNFRAMFFGASEFNHPVSDWNMLPATEVSHMFGNTLKFNQPLPWRTRNVSMAGGMFSGAEKFNQDLSLWCVHLIKSKPLNFDVGATAWTLPRPRWGVAC